MNEVNDGCMAVGEGITEKVSEFLVGIKHSDTNPILCMKKNPVKQPG